ncbi:putative conserved secreted protein [Synechococcus sp. WH 8101]|uniref:hypothetical protein n=1 Tax=Synechococcus sp. WH 8101 TaxID=59932 RepID=UPI00185F4270|nr:hypothetical protein [Synechococcus sp. WH 8101]QNI45407.1 putative conserved secreted protein [Synechococcus sp. WH 8101]
MALAPAQRMPLARLRGGRWIAVGALGLALAVAPTSQAAGPPELVLELECRENGGRWQTCRMGVVKLGEEWWLDLAHQRIRFRHDGSGRMRMKGSRDPSWQSVQARWIAERTLCWDGVCARGDLPLD